MIFPHHLVSHVIQQAGLCKFFSVANSSSSSQIQLETHFGERLEKLDFGGFGFCTIASNPHRMSIFKSDDTNNVIGNIIFISFEGFNKISLSKQYYQQLTKLIENGKRFNFKVDLFYEYSLCIIINNHSPQDMAYSVEIWFAASGSHHNYYMWYDGNHISRMTCI